VTHEKDAAVTDLPHAFETYVRVRFHEVDSLGHVNNAAYLNYLEQAAIDHATYLGLDIDLLRTLGGVFVARRHEIVFHQPAFAGDLLRVVTWLGEPARATVERHYRVIREVAPAATIPVRGVAVEGPPSNAERNLVTAATTEWVFTNEAGRPRRIPAEIVLRFRGM
jgi:acyl-CoA thioester hydrolase